MKNQSEQTKHTQGELRVQDEKENGIFIYTPNREAAIAKMYTNNCVVKSQEEAEANAQRIVKAVNMHDKLTEALKALVENGWGGYIGDKNEESLKEIFCLEYPNNPLTKAVQLLKQAEGK